MSWTINQTNEFKKGLKKRRGDKQVLKAYKNFLEALKRGCEEDVPYKYMSVGKDKGLNGWRSLRNGQHVRRHRLAGQGGINLVYEILKDEKVIMLHCIDTHQQCDLGEGAIGAPQIATLYRMHVKSGDRAAAKEQEDEWKRRGLDKKYGKISDYRLEKNRDDQGYEDQL